MQSIITQCQTLDEEYHLLVSTIDGMLEDLSVVSLEFVSSKLEFLEKYSLTLKSSQIDARIHRNSQIKNLIEYIKMHKKTKIKSVAQSPPPKMSHHKPKYSFNEKAFSTFYHSLNQYTQQKTQVNDFDESIQKCTLKQKNMNTLQQLINKQKIEQKKGNEDMFRLLQRCLSLIESKKDQYPEYEQLQKEYKNIIQHNKHLLSKVNLEVKSSKIKENLSQLIASQESFKSYLNSII